MVIDARQMECGRCNDHCYGDVVNVSGKYYHQDCFSCKVAGCNGNLIQDGYFSIDGEFYCRDDYHELHGSKCARCNSYVDGLAISAVNSLYHPTCFSCFHCNNIFIPDTAICYDGERISCENCNAMVSIEPIENLNEIESPRDKICLPGFNDDSNDNDSALMIPVYTNLDDIRKAKCASCGDYIGGCQSLMALEKPWHLRCFTCHKCGKLLAEEYIGRDGIPYCEQDYQSEFGVSCASCHGYITGKVLQAGGKHYHPFCSRCGKCDELFGEGEEMYLRGSEIWHPRCSEEAEVKEAMSDSNISDGDVENTSRNNVFSPLRKNGSEISNQTKTVSSDTKRYFERQERSGDNIAAVNSNLVSNGHKDDASAEHKVNIWKPPYQTSLSISLIKPTGFHSIKPPQISSTTASQAEPEEEDTPPPVPPPPKRSSSSSWRLKYSSGVYSPTPFQKPSTKNIKPISHENSISQDPSSEIETESTNPLSINTYNHDISNENEVELDGVSPNTAALIQKGIGFNRLQYRRSLRESQRKTGNK